jgi:hypothetical protein
VLRVLEVQAAGLRLLHLCHHVLCLPCDRKSVKAKGWPVARCALQR